jgi:REP element-mobilizing transposase RayT
MCDHVHMCISIPPKYAVSNVVGYMKGKSAITIQEVRRCEKTQFRERDTPEDFTHYLSPATGLSSKRLISRSL